MTPILAALLPIFALIALGAGLRRIGFPGDGFWYPLERLIYFLLFPALLVDRLSRAPIDSLALGPTVAAIVAAVLLLSVVSLWLGRALGFTGPVRAVVFMGATRFNTYVGLAAAGALYGSEGLTLAAMVLAIWVPLVNLLSVMVLAGLGERRVARRALLAVILNPLIIACAIGIALALSGQGLPPVPGRIVASLAGAALPLGLLAVGAGLDLGGIRGRVSPLMVASVCKLALLPAAMLLAMPVLAIDGLAAAVLLLFAALPGSPAAYLMARQMGGDAPLMAAIVTLTTLVSAATLPLWLAISI